MNDDSLKDKEVENNPVSIKKLFELTSYFFGAAFICGFLIWNVYLYALGFKEDDILQIRFIVTGICFIFLSTPLVALLYYINKKIIIRNAFWKFLYEYMCIILAIIYFIIYILIIFAKIPIALGGGRPRALSIITDSNNLDFLSKFSIPLGEGSKTQTANICVAYENEKSVVVLLGNRVLQLKKDDFKGFASLPGISVGLARKCSENANNWIHKAFLFEFMPSQKIDEEVKCEKTILSPQ